MSYSLSLTLLFSIVNNAFAATSEHIKAIAEKLVCLCGTCNRESLATCLCNYGESQRERIGRSIDSGKNSNEIIESFTGEFGPVVLASPPAEGINLLAWIAPIFALLFGALILRLFLIRRIKYPAENSHGTTSVKENTLDDERRKRLLNELKQFEESE